MSLLGNVFRSASGGRNDKPAAEPAAGEPLAAELRALAKTLYNPPRYWITSGCIVGHQPATRPFRYTSDAALARGRGGATEPRRGR